MKSLLPFLDSSPHKKQPKEDVEPPKPPPKTCDEWLASSRAAGHMVSADGTLSIQASKGNGAIKWPIHPPHMDWLVSATSLPGEEGRIGKKKHSRPGDTILGSLDEIKEDLRKHARMLNTIINCLVRPVLGIAMELDSHPHPHQLFLKI